MRKIISFADTAADTAKYHYRVSSPWLHLEKPLAEKGIEVNLGIHSHADAFYFAHPLHAYSIPTLEQIAKDGKKIIVGFDDNPFQVPNWFDTKIKQLHEQTKPVVERMLELATHKIVSTAPLAEIVPHSIVLPNLFDMNSFAFSPRGNKHDQLHVLFQGSYSHREDVRLLIEPIRRLSERYTQVRWIFWGVRPPSEIAHLCLFMPWERHSKFHHELAHISPDIGLCPLKESSFSACKSPIKYWEYVQAGAAVVASDTVCYDSVPHRAREDSSSWTGQIAALLSDPEYRKQTHAKCKADIAKHSWQDLKARKPWVDFFASVFNE